MSPISTRRCTGILVLVVSFLGLSHLSGQAIPFVLPKAEVRTLPRAANGRDYIIYVSFPLSYETSGASRRYPVVYLTDGYWDFTLVAYTADAIRRDGMAPETIVVGIGYGGSNPDVGTLRQWDLTPGIDPIYDSTGARTGRAEAFLGVFASEIIPFVETTYRADPSFRMLYGASFGGLFALYAAFERPGLFHGVIASSPSVDWRSEYVLGRARDHRASGRSLNTRLYVGWATGDEAGTVAASRRFAQEVGQLGIAGLRLAAREAPGAGHSGGKPDNLARGLRFVFSPQAWVRVGGIDPGHGDLGRLVNLSTRGRVGGGENVLVGGFVVQGILPKRVLVRAAGPSLGAFGVMQPLANPRLRVADDEGATVAENDDWGRSSDGAAIRAAAAQVGAFSFPADSLDAAIIVRLEPGPYTIVVDGVAGAEGVALVEAYELGP